MNNPKISRSRVFQISGALAVAGLLFAIVTPVFHTPTPSHTASATTLYEQSVVDAQTLRASDAHPDALTAQTYGATSASEIAATYAARIAAEQEAIRAAELAARVRAVPASVPANLGTGDGAIFPLDTYDYVGDGFRSRGGAHEGVDILAAGMTPIRAIADGVVTVSSEGYFGFGVAVELSHVMGGKRIDSTYGHMTYGTRTVSVGDAVKRGDVIGYVGSTGRSTANHLHLEIQVDGALVDPIAFLQQNPA